MAIQSVLIGIFVLALSLLANIIGVALFSWSPVYLVIPVILFPIYIVISFALLVLWR